MYRLVDAVGYSLLSVGSYRRDAERAQRRRGRTTGAPQCAISGFCGAASHRARRALVFVAFSLVVVFHNDPSLGFSFDDVAAQAKLQAQGPYRSGSRKPPAELQALNYDQYRDIRFRPDHALWRRRICRLN